MSDEIQLPSAEKVEREIGKVEKSLAAARLEASRLDGKLSRLRSLLTLIKAFEE